MNLREEFNSVAFYDVLKSVLGSECINCGSTKNTQYHHIVPLALGGTNNIKNIVPLCGDCYALVNNIDPALAKSVKLGRPSIDFPDNWEAVYKQWKAEEITAKVAMELLSLKRGTFYNLVKKYEGK